MCMCTSVSPPLGASVCLLSRLFYLFKIFYFHTFDKIIIFKGKFLSFFLQQLAFRKDLCKFFMKSDWVFHDDSKLLSRDINFDGKLITLYIPDWPWIWLSRSFFSSRWRSCQKRSKISSSTNQRRNWKYSKRT